MEENSLILTTSPLPTTSPPTTTTPILTIPSTIVAVYSDDTQAMSDRVQTLADSIYREFERLIKAYDEQVVKDLMPLVVAILENLDQSCREKQKADVDSELLKEDNVQLLAQYEKERQMRRGADQRYLALEDAMEDERKQLQGRLESLQSIIRMFEIKLKNSQDQVSRLDEKEQDMKKEYSKLHDRYTELFKSHLDFKDRLKTMMANTNNNAGLLQLPGDDIYDVTLPRNFKFSNANKRYSAIETTTTLNNNNSNNNDDLLTTTSKPHRKRPLIPLMRANRVNNNNNNNNNDNNDDDDVDGDGDDDDGEKMVVDEDILNNNLVNGGGGSGGGGSEPKDLDDDIPGQKRLIKIDERLRRSLIGDMDRIPAEKYCEDDGNYESHINHSIEEDDVMGGGDDDAFRRRDDDDGEGDGDGGECMYIALEESLEEVSDQFNLCGVSKEIDNLIQENNELLETKHALNIVKDDLIAKVDELTGEKEILKDEMQSLNQSKERLKSKVNDLEEEVKRLRDELEREMNKDATGSGGGGTGGGTGEDDNLAPGLRKRFTRLEMARVLMERNQYKEKLMELQEAVRWAEMVRATKDHPEFGGEKKSKSSLWNFFSNLFSSNNNNSNNNNKSFNNNNNNSNISLANSSLDDEEGVGLNSLVDRKKIVIGRSNNNNDDSSEVDKPIRSGPIKSLASKLLPLKEEPRLEAYGWSLPPKFQLTQLQATIDQSELINSQYVSGSKFNVPIPVLCKPLIDEEIPSKIQCAAAITWHGGFTKDGGCMVGASIFYNNSNNNNKSGGGGGSGSGGGGGGGGGGGKRGPLVRKSLLTRHDSLPVKNMDVVRGGGGEEEDEDGGSGGGGGGGDEVEKLNKELMDQSSFDQSSSFSIVKEGGSTNQNNPSHVWVCVIDQTGSHVVVMDAGSGGDVLEKFNVCTANVLCIAGVPGATEDDYKDDDDDDNDEDDDEDGGGGGGGGGGGDRASPLSSSPSSRPPPPLSSSPSSHPPLSSSPSSSSSSSPPSSSSLPSHVKVVDVRSGENEYEKKDLLTKLHRTLSRSNSRSSPKPRDTPLSEIDRSFALLPTVWLGSISGSLYIFSAVPYSRKRLHVIKLDDSILAICHVKGKVFLALANGCLACFSRKTNGQWNTTNYHVIRLSEPTNAVRAAVVVANQILWCSVANIIYVINVQTFAIEKTFPAHPRRESHVRKMAWAGEGVWVVLRHDSILRLFHAYTHEHLQDVDVEPCVTKLLGSSKLGFSLVQISCLMVTCKKLWVGTGNGVILCLPMSEDISSSSSVPPPTTSTPTSNASKLTTTTTTPNFSTGVLRPPGVVVRVYGGVKNDDVYPGSFVPYCSVSQVQLSFHGHREAVKFLVSVPGANKTPKQSLNRHAQLYRKFSAPLPTSASLSLPPPPSPPPQLPHHHSPLSSSPATPQQLVAAAAATNEAAASPLSSSPQLPPSSSSSGKSPYKTMWVVCGGDGYVDFRRDDDSSSSDDKKKQPSNTTLGMLGSKVDKSHVIVWQVSGP